MKYPSFIWWGEMLSHAVLCMYWLFCQPCYSYNKLKASVGVFRFYIPFLLSILTDLSKNRLTEIPPELCLFAPLESLNLYHNCIKCIPEAIINLQMLTYLDIRWGFAGNVLSVLFHVFIRLQPHACKEFLVPVFFHCTNNSSKFTWKRHFLFCRGSTPDASLCSFKSGSVFPLSPQSKSSVSSAQIPVQPSAEGFAREQQQAGFHPGGDWQV